MSINPYLYFFFSIMVIIDFIMEQKIHKESQNLTEHNLRCKTWDKTIIEANIIDEKSH